MKWARAWAFQQCGISTCVYSEEPLQPLFKVINSKWCSVISLTLIEYSNDLQRLWSDWAYAQAGLSFCWSHVPHCWKSTALAQIKAIEQTLWSIHTQGKDMKWRLGSNFRSQVPPDAQTMAVKGGYWTYEKSIATTRAFFRTDFFSVNLF